MKAQPSKRQACDKRAANATIADERAGHGDGEVTRRTMLVGSAAAAAAVSPVEAMARTLAAQTAAPLLLERIRRAVGAVHELRDIRAELAICQDNILRMDPHSERSRREQSRQFGLRYLQSEAERRAFCAANGMRGDTPATLKADVWNFAVTLHDYNLRGSLAQVEPDWIAWSKKRLAFAERRRARRGAKVGRQWPDG